MTKNKNVTSLISFKMASSAKSESTGVVYKRSNVQRNNHKHLLTLTQSSRMMQNRYMQCEEKCKKDTKTAQ